MSSRPEVRRSTSVKEFQTTLQPDKAEKFNECLMQIIRDPHADNVRKFEFKGSLSGVNHAYYGDTFVLFYNWVPLSGKQGNFNYRVDIVKAGFTQDFSTNATVPRL